MTKSEASLSSMQFQSIAKANSSSLEVNELKWGLGCYIYDLKKEKSRVIFVRFKLKLDKSFLKINMEKKSVKSTSTSHYAYYLGSAFSCFLLLRNLPSGPRPRIRLRPKLGSDTGAPRLSWPSATSPPTTSTVIYIRPGPGIPQCTPLPTELLPNDGGELDSQNVWAAAEELKQIFTDILRAAWNETFVVSTHYSNNNCNPKVLIS